jgi:hypothetical protein
MHCLHHRATRREFLGAGIAGTLSLALSPAVQRALAAKAPTRRATACILLWMNGGPSHIDTFDPKPGAVTGGPFKAIPTKVPGVRLSEHFPRLAQQARHFAVVRSLTSREADHELAYQFLHTGHQRDETVDYPALGSVMARAWTAEDGDLPSYVALNGEAAGGGFFGVQYSPYVVGSLDDPVENIELPGGMRGDRQERRLRALQAFNRGFARVDRSGVTEHERFTAAARRLQRSPHLKAFDLSAEKPATRTAYGIQPKTPAEAKADAEKGVDRSAFGKACLMARRLVEHGVRFVEVTLDGWDTHTDNFTTVETLCNQLDPAFAALVSDLAERGLLERTLVLCLGEFGRTPHINDQKGRDHWSQAFSAVLAGGGVRGGQVIGATDGRGEHVKDRPVTVPDLYATLLAAFGINGNKSYRTPDGRPIRLADKGAAVRELY